MTFAVPNFRSHPGRAITLAAVVWFVVYLVKCWQLSSYAVDMPWSDQWDGEISLIYFKAMDGTLGWRDFWAQANEHHIVLTKALALLFFELHDHGFRQMHVLAAQTMVFALIPSILVYALNREQIQPLASGLLVALFLPVFAFENFYWSYQSQVYFALLFGVVGTYLMSHERPSVRCLTLVTLVAGLSNGSSFFIPLLAALAVGFWGPRDRRTALKVLYFLALAMLSFKVFTAPTPGHDVYKATSLIQLWESAGRYSAWPGHWGWLFWPLLAGLGGFILYKSLRHGAQHAASPPDRQARFGLMLALWFGMFLASSIYARAGFPSVPSRYYDYYLIGFAGLVFLFSRLQGRLWLPALVLCMVVSLSMASLRSFKEWGQYAQNLNAYRHNMIAALKLVEKSPDISLKEVEAHLKKLPLPYAGYPNYDFPARIILDPRTRIIFRHWGPWAD